MNTEHMNINQFDGIAFDVEGTLADTIPLHHATRIEAFLQHGYGHITREEHDKGPSYGSTYEDILGGILHAAGEITLDQPFDENSKVIELVKTKRELYKEGASRGFEAMPGAIGFVQLVAPLFAGKIALVTSAEEVFVYPFIERYGINSFLTPDHVIGHETILQEGLRQKPHPDPYKLAMRRLDAQNLLVFEDTVPGVASAKKAGATVIAVGFDRVNDELLRKGNTPHPPDAVVSDYSEAAKVLGLPK
jgi:beta-phosphoglucomutase-like phosphatase (HAD superfamily)